MNPIALLKTLAPSCEIFCMIYILYAITNIDNENLF